MAGKQAEADRLGRKLTGASDESAFLTWAGLQGPRASSALQGTGTLADGIPHGGGVKHNDRDEEVYEGRDFEAVNLTFPLKNILMGVARWDKVEGGRERERKDGKRMEESLGLKGSEKVQE